MRLPPLLLNLLMLLAIVVNTIPAHAHASMPAMAAGHVAMTGAGEASATAGFCLLARCGRHGRDQWTFWFTRVDRQ